MNKRHIGMDKKNGWIFVYAGEKELKELGIDWDAALEYATIDKESNYEVEDFDFGDDNWLVIEPSDNNYKKAKALWEKSHNETSN